MAALKSPKNSKLKNLWMQKFFLKKKFLIKTYAHKVKYNQKYFVNRETGWFKLKYKMSNMLHNKPLVSGTAIHLFHL